MVPAQGGLIHSNTAADQTKQGLIVASPGSPLRVFNLIAFNPGAATTYVQFFDALTANVTVGTTTPTFVLPLPSTGGVQSGVYVPYPFITGLIYAVTATATGAGAPSGNAVISFTYF